MIRSGRIKPKKSDPALNRLKKLCRYYVVVLRDQNMCQRCGALFGHKPLEWAHVITRNAPSIVCAPWNSLALCGPRINNASCHGWFDNNKIASMEWWEATFPKRATTLLMWRQARKHLRPDLAMELRWFEREIVLAGGSISDAVKPRKNSEGA